MNKQPKVSIVMPTYNVERFLPDAVDSVLRQTFGDWELLIVDDGSTDNSKAVAYEYTQIDSRIRLLRKENGGLSDARNYGMSFAQGEYIHFFDSDDIIVDDFYDTMLNSIKERDDDFVICGYFKDFEHDDGSRTTSVFHCDNIRTPLPENRSYDSAIYYYAWNKLYKLTFLKTNKLCFEKGLSIIEDLEFFSRVIKCKPSFSCIDYLGYRYQVRKRSTLGNEYSENLIPSQLRGVAIQCDVLSFLCKDKAILQRDQGNVAYMTVKWVLYCIYAYSDLTLSKIHKKVKNLVSDETIMRNITHHKPQTIYDLLLSKSIEYKQYLFLSLYCYFRKLLNR